eukprot:scaffold15487_cov99-Skeletonema_dohrnii-CCMP3373.AAC.2
MLLRLVEISSSENLFASNAEKVFRFWRRRQLCSLVMAVNAWEKPRTEPRMTKEIVASRVVMMIYWSNGAVVFLL